mgnify:CR=1 FL=1
MANGMGTKPGFDASAYRVRTLEHALDCVDPGEMRSAFAGWMRRGVPRDMAAVIAAELERGMPGLLAEVRGERMEIADG